MHSLNFERNKPSDGLFKKPDARNEIGEIERVARTFSADEKSFVDEFLTRANVISLTELDESTWAKLENTDSYEIKRGDFETVANNAGQESRNWEDLKQKLEAGSPLDAPILMKRGEAFNLVSGNTRLMVLRALGIIPQVLLVDMSSYISPRTEK